jgi:hypothetical protein
MTKNKGDKRGDNIYNETADFADEFKAFIV